MTLLAESMHIGNIVFLFRVNIVLNRTESIVVDSDWRFDNLCGSHLQSQSGLYHISYGILLTVPSLPNHGAFQIL